jgi:hypothetical protein
MHGREGNVCGVRRGFSGEYAGGQNAGCEKPRLCRDVEYREALHHAQPFPRSARVPGTGFVDDKLRDAPLERAASFLPPFPCDLLVAGNDQIPARPRSQIARNGCFQIQSLLHHVQCLASSPPTGLAFDSILCDSVPARAAVAAGIDGVFVEVHDEPEKALSDGANALRLSLLGDF